MSSQSLPPACCYASALSELLLPLQNQRQDNAFDRDLTSRVTAAWFWEDAPAAESKDKSQTPCAGGIESDFVCVSRSILIIGLRVPLGASGERLRPRSIHQKGHTAWVESAIKSLPVLPFVGSKATPRTNPTLANLDLAISYDLHRDFFGKRLGCRFYERRLGRYCFHNIRCVWTSSGHGSSSYLVVWAGGVMRE